MNTQIGFSFTESTIKNNRKVNLSSAIQTASSPSPAKTDTLGKNARTH